MSKILVVDDSEINRLLLSTILEFAGHTIFEAADGLEALHMIREKHPDLVIFDLSMPKMNGATFIKTMRADSEIGQTRVALYTGSERTAAMDGFLEMHRIEYVIHKPSKPEDVLNIVGRALEG